MFHQTMIIVQVLSEAPVPEGKPLTDVVAEIGNGVYSGKELPRITTEVDGPTMAKLLLGQGSDPAFFGLEAEVAPCSTCGKDAAEFEDGDCGDCNPSVPEQYCPPGADICGGARCDHDEGSD